MVSHVCACKHVYVTYIYIMKPLPKELTYILNVIIISKHLIKPAKEEITKLQNAAMNICLHCFRNGDLKDP